MCVQFEVCARRVTSVVNRGDRLVTPTLGIYVRAYRRRTAV